MPETPKNKLKRMTAWDIEPVLTDGEIDELLAQACIADSAGVAPISEEWTPTYDLNAAAAAGWLTKAARAASLVEVDPPGSGIVTAKVFENCRAMAKDYRTKRSRTITTT
ncbi:MAG: hypothetical protein ACR2IH_06345 [Pyrinomonadaceae bacterium]